MRFGFCQVISLCACMTVMGADHLFRYDSAADFSKWKQASGKLAPLTPADRFASGSKHSFCFKSPKWEQGMPEWPSCEAKPLIADWSGYDRILVDITNPNPGNFSLSMFASDSKIPFRQAFYANMRIGGCMAKRFIFPLDTIPKTVDRKDMSIVHLFTQRPEGDMELYVGNMMLLKPGEKTPPVPASYVKEVAALSEQAIVEARKLADEQIAKLEEISDHPQLKQRLANAKRSITMTITNLKKQLERDDLTMEDLDALFGKLEEMPALLRRKPAMFAFHKAVLASGLDTEKMLVGTASSMVKVLPRDVEFEADAMKSVELSLARNEWESFQVLVSPTTDDLSNVTVSAVDVVNDKGVKLEGVEVDTVGYVKTTKRPPYKVSYVGWWPDPILKGCGPIGTKSGDVQSFWIRLRAGKTQPAGLYRGKVVVKADGAKPIELALAVKVRDFNVPVNTALPTAISTNYRPQMSAKEPWETMRFKYADFLADYQIDFDHLYRQGPPDWDVVQHLHKQGRLTAFNLGNVFNGGVSEDGFEQKMKACIDRIRPSYEKAKELGLLEYAYIYGFDERGDDQFPILERCAKALRDAFPGVILMTTSYDHSFGADTVVKTIDAWCPLTPRFDIAKAEKARKAGKYVWWYICCGPHNPHTNWFVEYAAIESRLLMGAQTAKFRPDGFLYYATTIWNQNKGIDPAEGPFTSWNPVSWTTYHGDGSLFHCDKDGNPLPSIRLENYRDGMEDYAYACILEEAITIVSAKPQKTNAETKWLADAKKALEVPEELVVDMAHYSRDPKVLRTWRDGMADAIEASGLKDLNPWGKGVFGVRGWRK